MKRLAILMAMTGLVFAGACNFDAEYDACIAAGRCVTDGSVVLPPDAGQVPDAGGGDVDAGPDGDNDGGFDGGGVDAGTDAGVDAGFCPDAGADVCDGIDNDCDGLTDELHVCPSDAVANTQFVDAGVWFHGTTSEGSCNARAVRQFWPTLSGSYITAFDCYGDTYQFRPDGRLLYWTVPSGILIDDAGTAADPRYPTPPCDGGAASDFRFDGQGKLHYRCGFSGTAIYAQGAVVALDVNRLAAVLDDGKIVATRGQSAGSVGLEYVLIADGGVIASFRPSSEFAGTVTLVPEASSTAGDAAYVMFRRSYLSRKELVVYRVGGDGTFKLVRRPTYTSQDSTERLAHPSGLIFEAAYEAPSDVIRAYLPDGGNSVVFTESGQTVKIHGSDQYFLGPLLP